MHLTYYKWKIIAKVAFPYKLRHKTGTARGKRSLRSGAQEPAAKGC